MDNDAALLARYVASRDAEAFAELAGRYAKLVFSASLRVTGNRHDAEEVTQECFLALARRAGDIRSSLPGWLHSLAVSRAKDSVRGNVRRRNHEKAREVHAMTGNSEPTWTEVAPQVDDAIAELPDELRQAIVMHFLQGRTQAEIAAQEGISQPTISRRVERALEALRDALRKRGVIVATVALAGMLASNTAEAVPAALLAGLGKMAAAGIGGAAKAGTAAGTTAGIKAITGGVAMKLGLSAIVAAVITVGGIAIHNVIAQKPTPPAGAGAAPAVAAHTIPDISAEQMLSLLQQHEAQIHQVSVKYTLTFGRFSWDGTSPIENAEIQPIESMSEENLYKSDFVRGTEFLEHQKTAGGITQRWLSAFDGEAGTTLAPAGGGQSRNVISIENDAPRLLNPKESDNDIYTFFYRCERKTSYGELLRIALNRKFEGMDTAHVKRVMLDNREVYLLQMLVFEPNSYMTVFRVWCDPTKSMLPVREETLNPDGRKLRAQYPKTSGPEIAKYIIARFPSGELNDGMSLRETKAYSDIREVKPGIFLAHRMDCYTTLGDHRALPYAYASRTLVVQQAEVNGDELITGRLEFQPGTVVSDTRTGRKYIAGTNSEHNNDLSKESSEMIEFAQQKETQLPPRAIDAKLVETLREQISQAFAAAGASVERGDVQDALEKLKATAPQMDLLLAQFKGTRAEKWLAATLAKMRTVQAALEKNDVALAKQLFNALNTEDAYRGDPTNVVLKGVWYFEMLLSMKNAGFAAQQFMFFDFTQLSGPPIAMPAMSQADREKHMTAQATGQMDSLREICKQVILNGDTALATGDRETARAHYQQVYDCGKWLATNPESLGVMKKTGEELQADAVKKLDLLK